MEIRFAGPPDTEKVKELWSYSFETYEPYFSWYFDTVYRPERTLCCFEGEELLSSLQLAPYRIDLRGAEVPIAYIVGVITSPQARGKGIAASLLNRALVELKKNGVPLAVLKPVCPSFYAASGFVFTYEEVVWQMEVARLKEIARPAASGRWYQYAGPNNLSDLEQIYQKMTARRNGYVLRSKENWQNFLEEHLGEHYRLWILKTAAEPRAYLLYQLKDRQLSIREIGYADQEALLNAFHFIYHHQNEADRFDWHGERSNTTYQDFSRTDGLTLQPSIMARVIDLAALLELNIYAGKDDFSLSLTVGDPDLPWHNANFAVVRANGRISVGQLPQGQETDLKTDIKGLTTLVYGSLSVDQLLTNGRIAGPEEALACLAKLLPPCANFMNEYS